MAGAGGASQRDHILEACRQTGKTPEELGYPEISLEDEEIPIPEDGLYLWFFFHELCGGRGNTKKLSPKTNHTGKKNCGNVKGGFDRTDFFRKCESSFDRRMGFDREPEESFDILLLFCRI